MDQKEFERITHCCDLVLRKFSADHTVTAISWLHVLNVHPNTIQHYKYALNKRNFFEATQFSLYNILYIAYKLCKSLFEHRTEISDLPLHADVFFVSHLVNMNVQNRNDDFYYGELPYDAETKKDIRSVTGLIDHTPGTKTKAYRNSIEKGIPLKYLFPKTLSFRQEIKLMRQCFSAFHLLIKERKKETDTDLRKILKEAALQSIAPETFYTLRIYESVNNIIKQCKPSNLVITWEGRAWERMAIYAARSFDASVKCIGYQHTILLSSSHSIKRSLGHSYDPDTLFTLGEITSSILQVPGEFEHTRFIPYGSYRLGFTGNENDHYNNTDQTVCLVTPEGLESESLLLFGFAVQFAKQRPDVRFIFRMHPVYPFHRFAEKNRGFMTLPSNCIVSDLPLAADLKRCNFLLYRASSVALYAVINGLKPVYYNVNGEMPIDSLYLMGSWRSTVQTTEDLAAVIKKYTYMTHTQKQDEYLSALAFCRKYVINPNENVFLDALSSKN